MKPRALKHALIALLVLTLAAPSAVLGQDSGSGAALTREQLSQMVAPIALYPDSLLANVLIAATFPLQVVAADRWLKQNKNLTGDQLNAALDKMNWDLSVKAIVPFPDIVSMMSEKLDWTQDLGNAFLAQQKDVMDAVQNLRARAQTQGNLKSTTEQTVVVKGESIEIEPANPTVIYVPTYNPTVVYGAWPYPAFPPYPYYPYGGVVAAGAIGFAAGIAVGAAWNGGWGHWNWGHGDVNVNVNRNTNINNNNINRNYTSEKWNQSARRDSIANRNQGTRPQPGSGGAGTPGGRGDYRGRTQDGRAQAGAGRGQAGAGVSRPDTRPSQKSGMGGSTRPTADSVTRGLQQRQGGNAFQGVGMGNQARMNSNRGYASRQSTPSAYRGSGSSRGGYGAAGGAGGSFSGAGAGGRSSFGGAGAGRSSMGGSRGGFGGGRAGGGGGGRRR